MNYKQKTFEFLTKFLLCQLTLDSVQCSKYVQFLKSLKQHVRLLVLGVMLISVLISIVCQDRYS